MAMIRRPLHLDDDTAKRTYIFSTYTLSFYKYHGLWRFRKFFSQIWSHLFFNLLHLVILIKVLLKFLRFLIVGMKLKLGVHVSMTKDRRVVGGNSFFFFFLDFVSLGWWMPKLVTGGHLMLFGLQYYVWLLLCHKI